MAKKPNRLTREQRDFVEHMGHLMRSWGLSRHLGRMYAYLLLRAEPVSLDEIALELGIAKSGASVSARQLAGFGLARSRPERGSRRIRYEPVYGLEPMLAARRQQFADWQEQLRAGVRVADTGLPRRRLRHMADTMERFMGIVTAGLGRAAEDRREPRRRIA